jgi:hypothetical protein
MLDGNHHKLRALRDKAHAGQWDIEEGVDWSIKPNSPDFLTRHFAARAVGALIAGEQATAGACKLLIDRLPAGPVRECLTLQAGDEERHARAYTAYLERIGLNPQPPDRFSIATEQLIHWSGPTAGLIFAVHIVLESEALSIQQGLAKDISCPLFRAVNQRIAQDEARHVAFGRLIAARAASELSADERQNTIAEIQSIWTSCVKALAADNGVLWRALAKFADRNWKVQLLTMERLGLATPKAASIQSGSRPV